MINQIIGITNRIIWFQNYLLSRIGPVVESGGGRSGELVVAEEPVPVGLRVADVVMLLLVLVLAADVVRISVAYGNIRVDVTQQNVIGKYNSRIWIA